MTQNNSRLAYYFSITVLTLFIVILYKGLISYPFFANIRSAFLTVLYPFIISFIVVYIFHPILYWIEIHFSIKTWVVTLALLIFSALLTIFLINILIPLLFKQLENVIVNFPVYQQKLEDGFTHLQEKIPFLNNPSIVKFKNDFETSASAKIGSSLIGLSLAAAASSFKAFWYIFIVAIMIFIMTKDYPLIYDKFTVFLERHQRSDWMLLLKNIDRKLGLYIRGQFVIMGYMFVLSYFPLLIMRVPNAFLFSVIIITTNVIPYVGPFIGAVPVGVYTLFLYPHLFIPTMLLILIIQQVDGNVGKPILFGSTLDMHPLMVIVVLILGGVVAGILGILVAIPVYTMIDECISFFRYKFNETKSASL